MKEINLFATADGSFVSNFDILKVLERVQAHHAKVLFIHTALNFGSPNPELDRPTILRTLLETVLELAVPTLIVPTFTFSFCNGVCYDLLHSRSKMGALNEYVRNQPGATRSIDPHLSVALIGHDHDIASNLGHHSIGPGSFFDKLHHRDGVKFLFFGARLGDCFTYMHYLEHLAGVPYRYDRAFTGTIVTPDTTYQDTYWLFVRYKNVSPSDGSYRYEEMLVNRSLAAREPAGDSSITCIDEVSAREVFMDVIRQCPQFFIQRPFDESEKDDAFEDVKDMVTL